jgi:hypothetical protein
MAGRQERDEPLDRAYYLSSLGSEVEAVARGDRSMQQCHRRSWPACATSSSARSAELGQSTSLSRCATTAATHADHLPPSASAFDETDITQNTGAVAEAQR